MVYVTDLKPSVTDKNWRFTHACFLVGDTEEELISFAQQLGLMSRCLHPLPIPYFKLNDEKRKKAIMLGAQGMTDVMHDKRVRKSIQHRRKRNRIYAT